LPLIPSANYDFQPNVSPTIAPVYRHPADIRSGPIPMAFQITSPMNVLEALLPHALVMHVNPANFNESYTKKVERFQTRGGWIEQHWGDELSEITADGSTSAFINIYTGTSSLLRQQTIAWDRQRDLHDLYRNNGDVYDPYGNIVLKGNVLLMYDRGQYIGYFSNFEIEETDASPFTFSLSWTFKVEQIIQQIPGTIGNTGIGSAQQSAGIVAPPFQATNTQQNVGPASLSDPHNPINTSNTSANQALLAQAQSFSPKLVTL
jgi:hypothetical protein